MLPRIAALPLLLLPAGALADPGPVLVRLSYNGYADGLHAVTLTSELRLGPDGYHIVMTGHTAGLISLIYHARWRTLSEGTWSGAGILPRSYDNAGIFGGDPRHVAIAFRRGVPDLQILDPRDDGEHEPLPPGFARPSIDTLALSALVIRQVAGTGGCSGVVMTYDGRQIQTLALHSTGTERLVPTDRSSFQGPAVRCDIDGRVLAGFDRDDPKRRRAIVNDAIWLAPVLNGAPSLPVRMIFTTRHLGRTTLYLTGAAVIGDGAMTASGH